MFLKFLPIIASLLAFEFVFIFHVVFEDLDHFLKKDSEFLGFWVFFCQAELVCYGTVVVVLFTGSIVEFHYLVLALTHQKIEFNKGAYLINIYLNIQCKRVFQEKVIN